MLGWDEMAMRGGDWVLRGWGIRVVGLGSVWIGFLLSIGAC